VKIDEQFENIVKLSDIRAERQSASTPFGPLNPASTTLLAQEIFRANQEARLTELLSSLESEVATLESKYCTALDTLTLAIGNLRAVLSTSTDDTTGTEEGML
jgi:hypothetical protein